MHTRSIMKKPAPPPTPGPADIEGEWTRGDTIFGIFILSIFVATMVTLAFLAVA